MKKILLSLLLLCSGMGFAQNHWTPENNSYEDYMSMYVVVQFYGVDMASSFLEIGAFCGDECRGSVLADYCPPVTRYVFYLPVYGNDGETLRFKLYDHQQEKELENLVTDELVYDYEGYGLGDNPYLMNFTTSGTGSQPSANVSIELAEGWNWISNLLTTETSLEDALVNLTPAEGDMIKSQNKFSNYENGQWDGTLDVLTPGKGYIYMREGEATSFSYPESSADDVYNGPFIRLENQPPMVVLSHEASLCFRVFEDESDPVIARGVCWSNDSYPTVLDNHTFDGAGGGYFTANMTHLMAGTSYAVCGYAITRQRICYSEMIYITTLNYNVTVNSMVSPEEGGSVSVKSFGYTYPAGQTFTVLEGQTCTANAQAYPGYTFDYWSDNRTEISTDSSFTFTVDHDYSLVAHFSINNYNITTAWTPDTLADLITVSSELPYCREKVEIYYSRPAGYFLKKLEAKSSTNPNMYFSLTLHNDYCTMIMPARDITINAEYQEISVGDLPDIHLHSSLSTTLIATNINGITRRYVFMDPYGAIHSFSEFPTLDDLYSFTFNTVGTWTYYVSYHSLRYGDFVTATKSFQVLP